MPGRLELVEGLVGEHSLLSRILREIFGASIRCANLAQQAVEWLQSRAEIDQKMFRGLVAKKLHRRVLSPAALTFFQKRFASGEGLVSIHSLAVYIHEQINGTFEDIFHKLSERVDVLEYPNNGSSTQVTLEDARLIVEDIGAHPDDLPKFLEDDKHRDKSVGFRTEPEAFESSIDDMDCLPLSACVPTRKFATAGCGYLVQTPS